MKIDYWSLVKPKKFRFIDSANYLFPGDRPQGHGNELVTLVHDYCDFQKAFRGLSKLDF